MASSEEVFGDNVEMSNKTGLNCDQNMNNKHFKASESCKDLLYISPENEKLKFLINKSHSAIKCPGQMRTFRPQPSSVLRQVKAFLPQMAVAEKNLNRDLEQKSPAEIDIESVEENEAYIEMNLALLDETNDTSDEEESDSDHDDSDMKEIVLDARGITPENFVITKTKGKKPGITELAESCADNG